MFRSAIRNARAVLTVLAILTQTGAKDSWADETVSPMTNTGGPFEAQLHESTTEIARQFVEFRSSKKDLAKKLAAYLAVDEQMKAIKKRIQSRSKNLTPEDRSILERELKVLGNTIDPTEAQNMLFGSVPVALFSFQLLGRGSSIEKWDYTAALARLDKMDETFDASGVSAKGGGRQYPLLLDMSCILPSLKLDARCLKKLIASCSHTFGSGDGKLSYSYLDEDLARREIALESPPQAVEALPGQSTGTAVPPALQLLKETYAAVCGVLAQERFEFHQAGITFKDLKSVEWLYVLGSAFPFDHDTFRRTCQPATVERFANIVMELDRSDLDGTTKEAVRKAWNGLSRCRRFIRKACAHVEHVADDKPVLHYITKDCRERAVTSEDVKRDLVDFKRLEGITEAAILSHAELSDDIAFCEESHKVGFSWEYTPPQLLGCKVR